MDDEGLNGGSGLAPLGLTGGPGLGGSSGGPEFLLLLGGREVGTGGGRFLGGEEPGTAGKE